MQGFEWHVPADHRHWKRLRMAMPSLRDVGVDNIWIPPGCKAMDPSGVGYDLYDLWDLGEFHQKGSRPTRWGSKEDLLEMMHAAQEAGIGIYWDTVLNHKAGADKTESFQAIKVDPEGTYLLSSTLVLDFRLERYKTDRDQIEPLRLQSQKRSPDGLGLTLPVVQGSIAL